MGIKATFKSVRDNLQQFIYVIINPVVGLMAKIGMTPNMVTTIGFLGNIAGAVLFVIAANNPSAAHDYYMIGWAGGVILFSSLFDMLDGQLARLGKMSSKFGAMYDSVLDRYSELATLGGISYFLILSGYSKGAILTFIALVGSLMVSYVRARAEGLGLECKIGFLQRPERVILTSIAAIVCGVYGCVSKSPSFDPMVILIAAMAFIAIFANMTAFARIFYCRRQLNEREK